MNANEIVQNLREIAAMMWSHEDEAEKISNAAYLIEQQEAAVARLRELARVTLAELESGLHVHKGDVGEMRIRPLALAMVKKHLWELSLPAAPDVH